MNTITISGRVGNDPEIYNGKVKAARFNVAVSRKGKKENEFLTSWFRCVAFGKTADLVETMVQKGSKVMVSGRHIQEEYEDKNGESKQSWTLYADMVGFIETPKPKQSALFTGTPADDEEIPF